MINLRSGKSSQSGNVFLAIFGAVAMVGVLGAGIMNFANGPIQNSLNINRKNNAIIDMSVVGQLAIMSATNTPNKGDCDSDTYVEPPEMRIPTPALPVGQIPLNGGFLPNTIGAAKRDPWGTEYGYCAWDYGPVTLNASCQGTPGVNKRLEGNDNKIYPVIAIISAGPDKIFTTTCRNFSTGPTRADQNNDGDLEDITVPSVPTNDLPLVSKTAETDDDLITSYSYENAMSTSGGLWKIKSSDANTVYLNKKIEVSTASIYGTGMFERIAAIGGDFLDVVSGLKLADPLTLTTCNITNKGILRRVASGLGIEICSGSSWTSLGGGGGGGGTATQINDLSDGIVIGTNLFGGQNTGNETLTGTGNTGFGVSALNKLTTGLNNTAMGYETLPAVTTGSDNTAMGWGAGRKMSGAAASKNTAMGYEALANCTICVANTAVGFQASKALVSGNYNTAVGSMALLSSTNGHSNSVLGFSVAKTATSPVGNVLIGHQVAKYRTTLVDNVGIGSGVMSSSLALLTDIVSRSNNVAVGYNSMLGAMTEDTITDNVAVGMEALKFQGSNSVAIGYLAAASATIGNENVAIGANVLNSSSVEKSVVIGSSSMPVATGVKNTVVGRASMVDITTGSNNTILGSDVQAATSLPSSSYNTVAGYSSLRFPTISNIGNTVAGALALRTAGIKEYNTAIGLSSLTAATNSYRNTAFGQNTMLATTSGSDNTAVGVSALRTNTIGGRNTAVGYQAIMSATTPSDVTVVGTQATTSDHAPQSVLIGYNVAPTTATNLNVAVGYQAINAITAGANNVAVGYQVGVTPGSSNVGIGASSLRGGLVAQSVALGRSALAVASGAGGNVAVGYNSMILVSSASKLTSFGAESMTKALGSSNTAFGKSTLEPATSAAILNTAFGGYSLRAITTATGNTALGESALTSMTTNGSNTAIGQSAFSSLTTGTGNVAIGVFGGGLVPSSTNNVTLGHGQSITTGRSNSVAIGYGAVLSANNAVRFGDANTSQISGQVAFTVASDARLKKDIHPTDLGLDFILRLQPVSFHMIDGNGRLDYGFIAQDVEKALEGRKTNLITHENNKMQSYKMRGDDLISPIVKAVQEQQKMLESLEKELDSVQ